MMLLESLNTPLSNLLKKGGGEIKHPNMLLDEVTVNLCHLQYSGFYQEYALGITSLI